MPPLLPAVHSFDPEPTFPSIAAEGGVPAPLEDALQVPRRAIFVVPVGRLALDVVELVDEEDLEDEEEDGVVELGRLLEDEDEAEEDVELDRLLEEEEEPGFVLLALLDLRVVLSKADESLDILVPVLDIVAVCCGVRVVDVAVVLVSFGVEFVEVLVLLVLVTVLLSPLLDPIKSA